MNGINKAFVYTAVVGAVLFTIVNYYLSNKLQAFSTSGTNIPPKTGSDWTNIGTNDNYQMTPQTSVYAGAPGRQRKAGSFNGQIFTSRFHSGGNHNSQVNYEQSGSIQSATKNPFANGPNNYYAAAVNRATQDPTNQVTALVLGTGLAPND